MRNALLKYVSIMMITMIAIPAFSQTEPAPQAKTQVGQLEGYIIGQPQYIKSMNVWRFKFAPKKNKELEGVYLMVTIPAGKGRSRQTYYLGDYVKLKANYELLKTAQTENVDRVIANDAAGS